VRVSPATEAGQRPLRQLTPSSVQGRARCHPLNACVHRSRARSFRANAGYESPARDWCALDGVAGARADRVAGTHPARVGDWRAGQAERTILTTDERVARGMVAWRPRLPNKRMQLTKLRAAPELQAEVPPCAPAGQTDGGTASQLIRDVRPTCRRAQGRTARHDA
jgi:hypothetical protein